MSKVMLSGVKECILIPRIYNEKEGGGKKKLSSKKLLEPNHNYANVPANLLGVPPNIPGKTAAFSWF